MSRAAADSASPVWDLYQALDDTGEQRRPLSPMTVFFSAGFEAQARIAVHDRPRR